MKTITKPLSHYEILHTPCKIKIDIEIPPVTRLARVEVVNENTGRVYHKLKKVTTTRADEMRPYKVSDFSLDNLISIGASLQNVHLVSSPYSAVTDMVRTLSSLESNNSNN